MQTPNVAIRRRFLGKGAASLLLLAAVVAGSVAPAGAETNANRYLFVDLFGGPITVDAGSYPVFSLTVKAAQGKSVSDLEYSGSCNGRIGTLKNGGGQQFTCAFDHPVAPGENLNITFSGRGHDLPWVIFKGHSTSLTITRYLDVV